MSSSSDSENDETLKQFLEATDKSFLTDAMFKEKSINPKVDTGPKKDEPKSQRYLEDTDADIGTDILIPDAVRQHFSKKFSQILEQKIEFSYHHVPENASQKKQKNKVKLLLGADCYVKPYEEFEYDFKGPGKKPNIKRRMLSEDCVVSEQEKCTMAAVNPTDLLMGIEVKHWANNTEKPNKIFHYKKTSNSNTLNAQEKITEFTKMRRKNQWNESKIKKR